MEKREVQIVALSTSESSPGNFSLVLEDLKQESRMVIIIGAFEAQAIAIYLERMQLPRPLTHDILKHTILGLGANLKEIIIHHIVENMFHALLIIETADRQEISIDARASDALALAIRFDCPVYVNEAVWAEAALHPAPPQPGLLTGSLADYSLDQLYSLLNDVLAKEDYESATRIRDMIRKRE